MAKYFDYEKQEKDYMPLTDLSPKSIRDNIGKRIVYLRNQDIDKSGRGYFFPRHNVIHGYAARQILLDDGLNSVMIRDIVEIAIEKPKTEQEAK